VTTSDSAPCQATGKLRAAIAGDVFVPGEHRYDQACQAWDLLADQRPAAVMLAESAVHSARASFANAAITAVEAELGPKTDALLSHLGAELPATLVSPRA
jgi:hypothetical protein